jgi:hypothetical protein
LGFITFDCDDPIAVASFWSAAIDRPVDAGATETFASIGFDDDTQPGWFFNKVPEGKTVKNRMHVDLHAPDREREIDRLIGLGAKRHSDHDEYGIRWTTMLDVEGNEFCIAAL